MITAGTKVGQVESLWRYPVKSMRGEQIPEAFAGFAGIYGDRICAFRSSGSPAGFPYLTGREQPNILRYQPAFRDGHGSLRPANLEASQALSPGITPVYDPLPVTVITPAGDVLDIDDGLLKQELRDGMHEVTLTLLRSDRAMTDCSPISLCSLQTVRNLEENLSIPMDKRRFRANIYADMAGAFAEEELVGRRVRIGEQVELAVLGRDARCKMITLDPETGAAEPNVMRHVAKNREGKVGIYCAVLVEGTIRPGDPITVG